MPSTPKLAAIQEALARFLEATGKAKAKRDKGKAIAKLDKAMQKAFRAQGDAFARKFEKLKGRFPAEGEVAEADPAPVTEDDWGSLWDSAATDTLALFEGPIDGATTTAILQGAKAVIADAGSSIAFDLEHPEAVAFLKGRAAAQVTGINDETKKQLRTLISDGVESKKSYSAIANEIADKFEGFADAKPQGHIESRAHLVAVTEVGEAYSEGNLQAGRRLADVGIGMEKSWSTVGDDKVSAGCSDNEGAGWIDIEENFPSGDQRPLRFPGCRCDLLMRAKGAGR